VNACDRYRPADINHCQSRNSSLCRIHPVY
jgi:hypothetical protein